MFEKYMEECPYCHEPHVSMRDTGWHWETKFAEIYGCDICERVWTIEWKMARVKDDRGNVIEGDKEDESAF